jgi:hypothetical protein
MLFVVALSLSLGAPLIDTAASPGNSANAKACQKGGWETLARTESPTVAFQSEEACVSYGARGGTLVPHELPVPVVNVTMLAHDTPGLCLPHVEITGFAPNTILHLNAFRDNEGVVSQILNEDEEDGSWTTDGDGAVSFTFTRFPFTENALVLLRVAVESPDIVSSEWVPYLC